MAESRSPGRLKRCKLAALLDAAPAAQRNEFVRRLFDAGWPDRKLARDLEGAGHYISPALLSLHRNGMCICRPNPITETVTT